MLLYMTCAKALNGENGNYNLKFYIISKNFKRTFQIYLVSIIIYTKICSI